MNPPTITIDNPTREEFDALMAYGAFNAETTFEDYLELCRERRALRAEAEREGWAQGYEEPPDLDDPETIQIFSDMLAQFKTLWAAQRKEAA